MKKLLLSVATVIAVSSAWAVPGIIRSKNGDVKKGDIKWLNSSQSYELKSGNITVTATAPHSSPLAQKIPWTEEPGRPQSTLSHRVGHDGVTSLPVFPFTPWRRTWQPTAVFLPGESQGWGSLVGCCLWGRTESDMTEVT